MNPIQWRHNLKALMATLALCGCQAAASDRAQEALARQAEERRAAQERSEELTHRGQSAYDKAQHEEAKAKLTEAVATDPSNARAWMTLGLVEYAREDYYKSAEAFYQASRLTPLRYEPRFNLGSVLEAAGKHSKAIHEYEAALALAPDQLEVMENLIRCYIHVGEKPDLTRQLIQTAIKREDRPEWRAWLQKQASALATAITSAPATLPSMTQPAPDHGR